MQGAPGVYLRSDAKRDKADYYCRFVKLEPEGLFYAVKFEVMVNRQGCVKVPRPTDQWVQRAYGGKLIALWIRCRTSDEMCLGDPFIPFWDPEKQANPCIHEWGTRHAQACMEPETSLADVVLSPLGPPRIRMLPLRNP